jgi:hypothetical protein
MKVIESLMMLRVSIKHHIYVFFWAESMYCGARIIYNTLKALKYIYGGLTGHRCMQCSGFSNFQRLPDSTKIYNKNKN